MPKLDLAPDLAQRRHRALQPLKPAPAPLAPVRLPPANGAPAAARAGSLIATRAAAPDVATRAQMSVGLQQKVGNARMGEMVAPKEPAIAPRAAIAATAAAATKEPEAAPKEKNLSSKKETKGASPGAMSTAPAPEAKTETATEKAATPSGKSPAEKPAGGKAAKRGAAAEDGGGASGHEDKSAGKAGAGRAVAIRMPPPPAGLSPRAKARVSGVQAAAATTASAHAALPPADEHVTAAQKAVTEPTEEANAHAALDVVVVHKAAPSPEIEELCKRIYDVIEAQRPVDEDALVKAEPEKMAAAAGAEVAKSVQGEVGKVDQGYSDLNQKPIGTVDKEGVPIPPAPAPDATPPVNAQHAVPDAVPEKKVSLDADVADSKSHIDDAGMSSEPAKLAQSGPVAEARAAEGELEQTAAEDPAKVLAGQESALAKAGGDMAALQQKALAALKKSRAQTVTGTGAQQTKMIGSDESMRKSFSARAEGIFTSAQTLVQAQLSALPETAKKKWDEGVKLASVKFKQKLKKVEDWIKERHSGFGGSVVGKLDDVFGLPFWVPLEYMMAEKAFGDEVCTVARDVSSDVNTVIQACEGIIDNARKEIDKAFAELPAHLQEQANKEKAGFNAKLDGLTKQAHDVRDNFNQELIKSASEAVDDVRQQIHALREKAKGILGRLADAIGRFLKDPFKFIIEALLELVGIPPAAFWAVVAKIKKVIGDIANDPMKFGNNLMAALGQGFSQFLDNFPKHLLVGFISWLTSGLKSVGVTLPKDASLKSILTFMLQLMGITWPNIRKLLLKHLGAKNVALIDKVVSLLSMFIELGPEGVFELIKDKLNPKNIVDTIINAAIDYMMTAIVKAVSARILLLFNPVGAIFQALEAIYRVLKWVFHNAARIFTLIETVVNGVADIIAGNITGMANAVEKALAGLIAPVIDFLADYLGFGDLPIAIADVIKGLQGMVLEVLEAALVWLIEKGKALLEAVGLGKKGGKPDLEGKVPFTAGGESHKVWVHLEGKNAVVMVASAEPTPIQNRLAEWKEKAKKLPSDGDNPKARAGELIAKAGPLAETIDTTAEDLVRKSEEAEKADKPAAATADTGALSEKEGDLAEILKELFVLFGESWAKPSEKWKSQISGARFGQDLISAELDANSKEVDPLKDWSDVLGWLAKRPLLADPLNDAMADKFWEVLVETSNEVKLGKNAGFTDARFFGKLERIALATAVAQGSVGNLRAQLIKALFKQSIDASAPIKKFLLKISTADISDETDAKEPYTHMGRFDEGNNALQFAFTKHLSWKTTDDSVFKPDSHHVWPTYLMGPDDKRVWMKPILHRDLFHIVTEAPTARAFGLPRNKKTIRDRYWALSPSDRVVYVSNIRAALNAMYSLFEAKYDVTKTFGGHCRTVIAGISDTELLTK
jgi:hypothetical protein